MVGLVKKALKHAIGEQALARKDFETIVIECESIVNQRPLTYSEELEDEALRPIDLISPKIKFPDYEEKVLKEEYLEYTYRFREVLKHVKRFWQVFCKDYQNQSRIYESIEVGKKAHSNKVIPIIGEIVLVKSDQQPRNKWRMARVVKLCPGNDGVVRSVEIKTKEKKILKRRIEQLIPLEIRPNPEKLQITERTEGKESRKVLNRGEYAEDTGEERELKEKFRRSKEGERIPEKDKNRKQPRKLSRERSGNILRDRVQTRSQTRKEREEKRQSKTTTSQKVNLVKLIMLAILTLLLLLPGVQSSPKLSLDSLSDGALNETVVKYTIIEETTTTTTENPNQVRTHLTTLTTTKQPKANLETTTTTTRKPFTHPITTTGRTITNPITTTERTRVATSPLTPRKLQTTKKPEKLSKELTEPIRKPKDNKESNTNKKPSAEITKQFREPVNIELKPIEHRKDKEKDKEKELAVKREAIPEPKIVLSKVKPKPWVAHNSESSIICTESGIQLIDKEVVIGKTYDVCTGNYCINEIEARTETDITFPAREVVNKHKITWKKPIGNQCTPAGDEANCQCNEVDLYKILEHKDHKLPIITEKYQLAVTKDKTPVLRMKHNQVHLRVNFNQKYDIAVTKSEVDCEISEYSEFKGCYNCNQGAVQKITCKANKETHAKLSCNNTEFIDILTCNEKGFENEIHRKFEETNPVDTCKNQSNHFNNQGINQYNQDNQNINQHNQNINQPNINQFNQNPSNQQNYQQNYPQNNQQFNPQYNPINQVPQHIPNNPQNYPTNQANYPINQPMQNYHPINQPSQNYHPINQPIQNYPTQNYPTANPVPTANQTFQQKKEEVFKLIQEVFYLAPQEDVLELCEISEAMLRINDNSVETKQNERERGAINRERERGTINRERERRLINVADIPIGRPNRETPMRNYIVSTSCSNLPHLPIVQLPQSNSINARSKPVNVPSFRVKQFHHTRVKPFHHVDPVKSVGSHEEVNSTQKSTGPSFNHHQQSYLPPSNSPSPGVS
ncbi:hypothetical protein B9Z55_020098 [Caenorhabditis nigoni]|uniref:DUF5641 domain-containing protein n=1 Tax=Caenorhabditis nigoni TaxID=1611254 RepID=A0A2G5TM06_9PELO|nr:hypothetical protein B9Z55_020098 [Caenorhabditis nigoni]